MRGIEVLARKVLSAVWAILGIRLAYEKQFSHGFLASFVLLLVMLLTAYLLIKEVPNDKI